MKESIAEFLGGPEDGNANFVLGECSVITVASRYGPHVYRWAGTAPPLPEDDGRTRHVFTYVGQEAPAKGGMT